MGAPGLRPNAPSPERRIFGAGPAGVALRELFPPRAGPAESAAEDRCAALAWVRRGQARSVCVPRRGAALHAHGEYEPMHGIPAAWARHPWHGMRGRPARAPRRRERSAAVGNAAASAAAAAAANANANANANAFVPTREWRGCLLPGGRRWRLWSAKAVDPAAQDHGACPRAALRHERKSARRQRSSPRRNQYIPPVCTKSFAASRSRAYCHEIAHAPRLCVLESPRGDLFFSSRHVAATRGRASRGRASRGPPQGSRRRAPHCSSWPRTPWRRSCTSSNVAH